MHCDERKADFLQPPDMLSESLILSWADTYHAVHGRWPQKRSGPVVGAPGETWNGIDAALRKGSRGLGGGSSLADLLARHRGQRNRSQLPPLTLDDIASWAWRHRRRHGRWPTGWSGPINDAAGENWHGIDAALRRGLRGLPAGSSLRLFLRQRFKVMGRRSPLEPKPPPEPKVEKPVPWWRREAPVDDETLENAINLL
jgi:hypothetical protein